MTHMLAALALTMVRPREAPLAGTLCAASEAALAFSADLPPELLAVARFLQPFRFAAQWLMGARMLGPVVAPGLFRTACYWLRLTPIIGGYALTHVRARLARRRSRAEALWQRQHERGASAVSAALLDLGGFYLKLGQVLATKGDVLPGPYVEALSSLFGEVPAEPFRRTRRTLESELGGRIERHFSSFEREPIASATVAQVHRAVTAHGEVVAVKVQRHGAFRAFQADMRNLLRASALLRLIGLQPNFDMHSILLEYKEEVPWEFEFRREARMMTSIRESLKGAPMGMDVGEWQDKGGSLRIPVPRGRTTRRILAMDFFDGPLLYDAGELAVGHMRARANLFTLVHALGKMIFIDGRFHTDIHPGNLIAVKDGNLGLLDFGQCKEYNEEERLSAAHVIATLASRSEEAILKACKEAGLVVKGAPREMVLTCAYILFDTRMDIPEAQAGPELAKLASVARVTNFPQSLFMMMRVVTMLRGLLAIADIRDLSVALEWAPYARTALTQHKRPLPPEPAPPSSAAAPPSSKVDGVKFRKGSRAPAKEGEYFFLDDD